MRHRANAVKRSADGIVHAAVIALVTTILGLPMSVGAQTHVEQAIVVAALRGIATASEYSATAAEARLDPALWVGSAEYLVRPDLAERAGKIPETVLLRLSRAIGSAEISWPCQGEYGEVERGVRAPACHDAGRDVVMIGNPRPLRGDRFSVDLVVFGRAFHFASTLVVAADDEGGWGVVSDQVHFVAVN